MAKVVSVTGMYFLGTVSGTELVHTRRGKTFYVRAHVNPSQPRSDGQKVTRAAMTIANALFKFSYDRSGAEWKDTLRAVTGVQGMRQAWTALMIRSASRDQIGVSSINFLPGVSGWDLFGVQAVWNSAKDKRVILPYFKTNAVPGKTWAYLIERNADPIASDTTNVNAEIPFAVRKLAEVRDEDLQQVQQVSDMSGANLNPSWKVLPPLRESDGLHFDGTKAYGILVINVEDEPLTVWDPNGTPQEVHPIKFAYVANITPGFLARVFSPEAGSNNDWRYDDTGRKQIDGTYPKQFSIPRYDEASAYKIVLGDNGIALNDNRPTT